MINIRGKKIFGLFLGLSVMRPRVSLALIAATWYLKMMPKSEVSKGKEGTQTSGILVIAQKALDPLCLNQHTTLSFLSPF